MPINISIDHFIVPRLFFTLITCCYSYIIFFELLKMGQDNAELRYPINSTYYYTEAIKDRK